MINPETAKPAVEKITTGINAITDAITTPSEHGGEERATPDDPSRQWICIYRPEAVRSKEQAPEAIQTRELLCGKSRVGGPKCMCFESADAFPEHKWVMTLAGRKLFHAWKLEQHLRDPDCYGREITVPIFRKWSGYGICEVIENMALAINDNQGNGKRIMLIGTALLTTIDLLKTRDRFKTQSSFIRNIGLTRDTIIKDRSITRDDNAPQKSDKPPKSRANLKKTKENITKAYAPKPTSKYGGLITLDFLNEGTKPEWEAWDWATELRAYTKEQAVKVGPYGPMYDKRIGGRFYDLTAPGNRGRHAESFIGPPDSLATEDSEDDIPPEDIVYCPGGKPAFVATASGGPDGGPRAWCRDKSEETCGTVPYEFVKRMTAKANAERAERQR
ncbi:MAG: hypothetical protein Q9180_001706 [Flavoplaca navasiana]